MRFEVGQRVRLHANGGSVFKVLEVDYEGNSERVLIESVEDTPGTYPWSASTTLMVNADE
ncbi:hypothetical protein [Nocardia ignorata]|uniref:Uncharacterized protein n=1 Tax=Nocardia ignorata TaxID=145285 RepID=A0A4R6NZU7_NOCIG|nr:hypothetical protein [Nocardia ignorata]TDP29847.1 hypothetical protein DFR75_112116 [Nocardia ignorata]